LHPSASTEKRRKQAWVHASSRLGAAQGAMPTPAPVRMHMTVPETPDGPPAAAAAAAQQALQERLKAVQLAGGEGGGPGRFEDNTPSRRATKSRRVAGPVAGAAAVQTLRGKGSLISP
jgi:hypothetical protein